MSYQDITSFEIGHNENWLMVRNESPYPAAGNISFEINGENVELSHQEAAQVAFFVLGELIEYNSFKAFMAAAIRNGESGETE